MPDLKQSKQNLQGFVDRYFDITERKSTVQNEILGGITTFLTMSYIIFVNPSILSIAGMDKGALITVTCLVSAFATVLMGLLGRMPIALAPGMGLNAFFTFSLVISQGIPWQQALGIVFLSGLFFLIMSLSGIRRFIAHSIPKELTLASTAGIGLFIAFIGLKSMGVIVANEATLVALGQFDTTMIISLFTLFVMKILHSKNVSGGILIGILVGAIIGMILGKVDMPTQLMSLPPSIEPIAFKLDILGALKWSFFGAIFSFMFIDMFDSLAFLLACSEKIGLPKDKNGEVKGLSKMLYVDVISTLLGSVLGTSTVTSFGESAAGIATGAKTGLASVITGLLFLVAVLFTPLIAVVPMFAVAPALVIVGVMMFEAVALINFSDKKIAATVFMTIIFMPLTYSISIGLSFGFITYIVMHLMSKEYKKISVGLWLIGILCVMNLILL